MTQGQGDRAGAHSRRYDTAPRRPAIRPARRTTRLAHLQGRAAARARDQATGSVPIQSFVSWRRGSICVATRAATRCPGPCDTGQERCDTARIVRGRELSRDTNFVS